MSGLAGLWRPHRPMSRESLESLSEHMLASMSHRGSVRHIATHPAAHVAISACRPANGPISAHLARTADGRHIVVIAGEFDEPMLRPSFHDIDTPAERLLRRVQSFGVERALSLTRGSIGVAVLDTVEGTLTLARDKMGEKSLYFAPAADGLFFASELAAIVAMTGPLSIDLDAVGALLQFGYIPAPHTIYRGVHKLPPGCLVRFALAGDTASATPPPIERYWDVREVARKGIAERRPQGWRDAANTLHGLLDESIDARHGGHAATWLSGDAESSMITALLQARHRAPVQAVGIGYEGVATDTDRPDRIASYLGCRFDEVMLANRDLPAWTERAAATCGEPLATPSFIPTLAITAALGDSHKRLLLGEGADALFFGNPAYRRAIRHAGWMLPIPRWARQKLGTFPIVRRAHAWLGGTHDHLARLHADSVEEHYLDIASLWQHPSQAVPGSRGHATIFSTPARWLDTGTPGDRLQYIDHYMGLGEGHLPATDRACLAHGVTPYFPLLDEAVVQCAWRLPMAHKHAYRTQKLILAKLAERYLPEKLLQLHRPPPPTPIAAWLRGPLREWAGDLLNRRRLQHQGIFDADEILPVWEAFLEGKHQWHAALWPVLTFQAWHAQRHL